MKAEKQYNNEISRVALLVSLACVLQTLESLVPHPIPGLRLGLANVITLIALVNLDFRRALEITILRTLLSSFIMGTFMSPAFILSFSAGMISTLVMGFLYWLSGRFRYRLFGIVGISVAGALFHNLAQLYLAYLILVKHTGIFAFLPWLCIGAVFTGWFTAIIAVKVCLRLQDAQGQEELTERMPQIDYINLALNNYAQGSSPLHRLSAEIKIAFIFVLSLTALFVRSVWLCAGLSLFLAIIIALSRLPLSFFASRIKRYFSLVLISFLLPVFFNSGKHIILQAAYFKITAEGLSAGMLFAWRIVFLILLSALLSKTTSPKELAGGLSKILFLLGPIGISGRRITAIFTLSWMSVPVFGEMARDILQKAGLSKARNMRNLVLLLSDFIATLYLQAAFLREEVVGPDYEKADVDVEKVYC